MIVRVIKVFEGLTYFLKTRLISVKLKALFSFSPYSLMIVFSKNNHKKKGGYMNSITDLFDDYVSKEHFSTWKN